MAKFFDDPAVKLVIAHTKAIAIDNGLSALNERCLLGAIMVSFKDPLLSAVSDELVQRLDGVAMATKNMSLSEGPPDKDLPSMPLTKSFRELLGNYAEAKLSSLPKLVDDCVCNLRKEVEKETMQFKNRIKEMQKGPEYVGLLHSASFIANSSGATCISRDALAVAAWRCHELGIFQGRPAFVAHMQAYSAYFAAKARHGDWAHAANIKCVLSRSDAEVLPWAEEIEHHEPDGSDAAYALLKLATKALMQADCRRRAAFHEAGHGVAFAILRPDIRLTSISVKETRSYAGVTSIDFDTRTNPLMNYGNGIFQHVVCLLAGRAAETAAFGPTGTNSGAVSDIKLATSLLWDAIAEEGLSVPLGPIHLPTLARKSSGISTHLTRQAEKLLQSRMKLAQAAADNFVRQYFSMIEAVANKLNKVEEMTEDDVRQVMLEAGATKTNQRGLPVAA